MPVKKGYADANPNIVREIHCSKVLGIADTSVDKFHFFQKAKLKAVHGTVVVAGTNAVAGFDILVGTTSVGGITFGTTTAGSTATSGAINAAIPANGHIDVKGKATSATLVASLCLEYEVDHDANQTA
jgi:hypothetical protein